jgi:hypothetical protein
MTLLFFLFSILVFLINGWVGTLLLIVGLIFLSRSQSAKPELPPPRQKFLQEIISALTPIAQQNPQKPIIEVLSNFRLELTRQSPPPTQSLPSKTTDTWISVPSPKNSPSFSWENWYTENSINLLLYVGAFLIVASAATFVGFQWQTIDGVVKALLLTAIAIIFFTCGIWFTYLPKVRSAGIIFTAIGAVLIPIVGFGWHTFVFAIYSPVGITWFITSIIALIVYASLALHYRYTFYSYAAIIGTLSTGFSIINTLKLDPEFYILSNLVIAFILLIIYLLTSPTASDDIKQVVLNPIYNSASIIFPLSFIWGITLSLINGQLATPEVYGSFVIAITFYSFSYDRFKNAGYFTLTAILLPLSFIVLFHWLKLPIISLLYLLGVIAILYSSIHPFLRSYQRLQESDVSLTLSNLLFIGLLLQAVASSNYHAHAVVFSILSGLSFTYLYTAKAKPNFLFIAGILGALALHLGYNLTLQLDAPLPQAVIYLFGAISLFSLTLSIAQRSQSQNIGYLLTGIYLFIGILIALETPWFLSLTLMVGSILSLCALLKHRHQNILHLSLALGLLALINQLSYLELPSHYFSLVVLIYACALYSASSKESIYRQAFRQAGLGIAMLAPAMNSAQLGFHQYLQPTTLYAIITAYGTTTLLGLDAYIYPTKSMTYFASAIGTATLLWHLHFLKVDEVMVFSTLIALYFFIHSFIEKRHKMLEIASLLEQIGLLILLLLPAFLSLGEDALKYSLYLGGFSLIALFIGIGSVNRNYQVAGIIGLLFSIIPQTYQYIVSLPRWIGIGALGLIFLGIALYLLLKRNDNSVTTHQPLIPPAPPTDPGP